MECQLISLFIQLRQQKTEGSKGKNQTLERTMRDVVEGTDQPTSEALRIIKQSITGCRVVGTDTSDTYLKNPQLFKNKWLLQA